MAKHIHVHLHDAGNSAKDSSFPNYVKYKGESYAKTGKEGKSFSTGEKVMEYQFHPPGKPDKRVWLSESGKITQDSRLKDGGNWYVRNLAGQTVKVCASEQEAKLYITKHPTERLHIWNAEKGAKDSRTKDDWKENLNLWKTKISKKFPKATFAQRGRQVYASIPSLTVPGSTQVVGTFNELGVGTMDTKDAKKLVQTEAGTGKALVKIYYDPEWEEYQCELYLKKPQGWVLQNKATYHTDDKQDALSTAKDMVRRAEASSKDSEALQRAKQELAKAKAEEERLDAEIDKAEASGAAPPSLRKEQQQNAAEVSRLEKLVKTLGG